MLSTDNLQSYTVERSMQIRLCDQNLDFECIRVTNLKPTNGLQW